MAVAHKPTVHRLEQQREFSRIVLSVWPRATIEHSALECLPGIELDAVRAVVEAARTIEPHLDVTGFRGHSSEQDADWHQLVFVIGPVGEPGTSAWHGALTAAGQTIERAMSDDPASAEAIAAQISFEV